MIPQDDPVKEKTDYLYRLLAIATSNDWVSSQTAILKTIETIKNQTF